MKKFASSLNNKKKFLILGCGFSGSFFAKTIRKLGFTALTSSRCEKKDPNSFVFNSENSMIPNIKIFDGVTHILSCIPPDKNGKDPVLNSFKNQLQSLSLEWVGYLSTTGVYGNTNGNWVSEIDQPKPFQKRSHKRLNCEKEWIASGLPVQIFRLPGIYGPGRSTLEAIKNQKIRVIAKENQVFSRIHVADITNAILYLLQNKDSLKFHQIINIADDEPCSQIEVIQYSYDLLGLKMPEPIFFEEAKKDLSPFMNFKKENIKSKIIISVGDESGIGPEIILKALASKEIPKNIDFTLVGSKKNLQLTYEHLRYIGVKNLANPNNLQIQDLEISSSISNPKSNYGNSSFYYLKKAIEIVKQYPSSALVTGPICKKSWSLSGHYFSGQTEVLAKSCGIKKVGMLFTAKSPITGWRFNTLLATTHIALREVPKKLTTELIHSKLDLFKDFCSTYNDKPILKVAGLNPHAGEEGILGNEEKDWLNNALISWNEKNRDIKLLGPLSPDSCWNSSAKAWRDKDAEKHDGILAMYHDQGLIPMKVIALNYSVNTTIGLPFIRTSPDHGTGFDIAGKGIAQSQSMIEAIKAAIEMIKNSRLLNTH